jgi:hypothetical protein
VGQLQGLYRPINLRGCRSDDRPGRLLYQPGLYAAHLRRIRFKEPKTGETLASRKVGLVARRSAISTYARGGCLPDPNALPDDERRAERPPRSVGVGDDAAWHGVILEAQRAPRETTRARPRPRSSCLGSSDQQSDVKCGALQMAESQSGEQLRMQSARRTQRCLWLAGDNYDEAPLILIVALYFG